VKDFLGLGAKLAKPLELGDPRVARWDKVDFEVTLSLVRSRLKLGGGFSMKNSCLRLRKLGSFVIL